MDADVIFVLGAPAAENGEPSAVMRTRVEKGVELLQKGYAPHIVFQGGAALNDFVEAEVMGDYARQLGVEEEQLYLEGDSRDTLQNVEEATKLMRQHGWRKAIVVTSKYHARRTREMFADRQVDATVVEANYPAEWGIGQRLNVFIRDYVLLIWYRLTRETPTDD